MLKRLLIAVIFLFTLHCSIAQDMIYLNNGNKFSAIVTEINPDDIKYKSISSPSGPQFVISRKDVLLIEYKTGEIEIINKNPEPYQPEEKKPLVQSPRAEEPSRRRMSTEQELRYLHKSSLMINGLALANADITFLYDHEFANSHLSVTLLGGYNFNKAATWPNAIIQNYLVGAKKNYDVGAGINFYPSNRKRVQYFMGLWWKYMSYNYLKEVIIQEEINGTIYQRSEFHPKQSYQLATLFVNGWQIRINPFMNYKLLVGIGGYKAQPDLKEAIKSKYPELSVGTQLKMYVGMCFGYRF